MIRRRHLPPLAAALAAPALVAPRARAQSGYPDRGITLVVPYPPGGSSDNTTRPIAPSVGRSRSK